MGAFVQQSSSGGQSSGKTGVSSAVRLTNIIGVHRVHGGFLFAVAPRRPTMYRYTGFMYAYTDAMYRYIGFEGQYTARVYRPSREPVGLLAAPPPRRRPFYYPHPLLPFTLYPLLFTFYPLPEAPLELMGTTNTEAEVVAPEVGGAVAPKGRPQAPGIDVPTTAAPHAANPRSGARRVGLTPCRVISVPVPAPLPYIPAHVIQP
jgi:hypothetical protein